MMMDMVTFFHFIFVGGEIVRVKGMKYLLFLLLLQLNFYFILGIIILPIVF